MKTHPASEGEGYVVVTDKLSRRFGEFLAVDLIERALVLAVDLPRWWQPGRRSLAI